jgi:ABC-2 type transport system permease protein
MNNSLLQLISTQFKSFFREPAIIFWAIIFPILMAWVLGIAFTQKGELTKTVYVIEGNANERISSLKGEKVLGKETGNPTKITFIHATKDDALVAIKRGEIALFMEAKNNSIIYTFDPSNPDAQLTHLILERELNQPQLKNASSIAPLTNRGSRYIDFLIPGLIAFGIMNSCLWGISWNLIEFRMKKLLRRMVATPMKKSSFLGAYLITRIIISLFESTLLFLFAYFYFGTVIEGSIPGLILVYLSGIFAFSGLAILVASRTQNTQVGNGLINVVVLPMTILSGIFFNYHNFPDWAIPVIKALPLTLVADTIRAIFIEGAGFADAIIPTAILTAVGATCFSLGLRIFKWY